MFIVKCILGLGLLGILYIAFNIIFPPIEFDGWSMYPTYEDKEVVRGMRLFNKKNFKLGYVYVFTRERDGETYHVIKRLTKMKLTKQGLKLFFEGDNSLGSVDSRHYGYVDSSRVVARVIKPKEKMEDESNEEIKCS